MTLDNVHDLFEVKLQVMLSAERRILDVLDDAINEVQDETLRQGFKAHREETTEQIVRIEGVFESLGKRARIVDASVVEGLVEERRRFLSEEPTREILDLFHVAAAVKTEHLEIAAYEDLINLAEQMGAPDLAEPLRKNLDEERATLEMLMRVAKEGVGSKERAKEGKKSEERSAATR